MPASSPGLEELSARSAGDGRADVVVLRCEVVDQRLLVALRELTGGESSQPVIVVCERLDAGDVRALVAAGVAGVVREAEADAALAVTKDAVMAGQICVPSINGLTAGRRVLSIREKQVVGLLALGLTNREIAQRLFVAETTVKSHLSSAFSKLGVRSRHEAIDLIVDPSSGLGVGILSLVGEPMPETGIQATRPAA